MGTFIIRGFGFFGELGFLLDRGILACWLFDRGVSSVSSFSCFLNVLSIFFFLVIVFGEYRFKC